ncbi:CDP-alcohol phosphatidyltransferase family protein [Ferruginibacter albus]|uniref:CDP-alcohol phosphatidyltransferase family protein n=1 Tax=Ferruginibacter albus TaxID=2875540 RepID=UPI001CC81AEA|nr:CDP-alcohol phosphatidyltransferase family protein [Ferruginibacter albus]UAY51397.1 CDP-alcohol phosphatidyltransferase family protein [Ferruginibacter albus]
MKQIPNLFTLTNLFLGAVAIVFALQTQSVLIYTNDEFASSFNIPENLSVAALLLFFAAVVDFLDGFVARLFKATSEMGKQLDSLADVVSFGVAPGVIVYQLLRMSYAQEEMGLDVSIFLLLPAFLISCAAAYRLAKFNIDTTQQYGFKGVPTPAVGLLIASFPLILHFPSGFININEWLINKWFLYSVIIVVSWLMVSNLPLLALKFKNFSFKNNQPQFILIALGIVAVLLLRWLAIPVIFIAYIILSLLFKNKQST